MPNWAVSVGFVGVAFFDAMASVGDAVGGVTEVENVTRVAMGTEQRLRPIGGVEVRRRASLHWIIFFVV